MLTPKEIRVLSVLRNTVERRESGATVATRGESPTNGFMVGGVAPELVMTNGTRDLPSWVARNSGEYFGIWRDDATGKYHADISEHYADRETAIEIARQRGEIAIWDLANGTEIRV